MGNRVGLIALGASLSLAGVLALAGCAPQASSQSTDQDAAAASASDGAETAANWSPDADCAACHEKEASSAEAPGCLAQAHAQLGYVCADCHADEQSLTAAHKNGASGTPATRLQASDVDDAACLACHDSREAIAAQTTDVTIADDKGTAVNPHALPASPDHYSLACIDCHTSHEAAPALEEAESTCASCHHAGVFECGTCHS